MLKLSPRPHPEWVRRSRVTRDDLRMHWAGRQAFADPPSHSEPTDDGGAGPKMGSGAGPRETIDVADAIRSTPTRQRAEALVLTMARYRCVCCGGLANAVRERSGAAIGTCDGHALEPVCARCDRASGSDGPMADAVAEVMARFRPVASSA